MVVPRDIVRLWPMSEPGSKHAAPNLVRWH